MGCMFQESQNCCVLHVVPDLAVGGAQAALVQLVTATKLQRTRNVVATLTSGGFHSRALRAADVDLIEFEMRSAKGAFAALVGLVGLIRKLKPEIVQGWLHYGDLAALLAVVLSGRRRQTKVVWSIRSSATDVSSFKYRLRLAVRVWRIFVACVDLVIANSTVGLATERNKSWRLPHAEVISNGIDTDWFRPDPVARRDVRKELRIPEQAVVVIQRRSNSTH